MSLIRKALSYYREHGLKELIYRIHRRRRFIIYVKEIQSPRAPSAYPDVVFAEAGLDDAAPMAKTLEYWGHGREALVKDLLADGDVATIGFSPQDRSEVMYVSWLSTRDTLFDTLFGEEADAEDACSRRVWVPEAYRRRGLARRGLKFAESVAAAHGIRRIWVFVFSGNKPSRRLHEQLGYQEHGVLRLGRYLGKRFAEVKRRDTKGWCPLKAPEPPTGDRTVEHDI